MAFGHAGAVLDQILREPDRLAFFGAERMPGQHHVHHAGHADERRQAHRPAAADEDAAASLRQRIERRRLRHADMGSGGKFEPAADDRAVEDGDDGHFPELNAVEGTMPEPRMLDAGEDVALLEFRQVEPGAEMLAVAGQDNSADVIRQGGEERLHSRHRRVVERVAFLRAMQPQHRNFAAPLGAKRRWQNAKIAGAIVHGKPVGSDPHSGDISAGPRQGAVNPAGRR